MSGVLGRAAGFFLAPAAHEPPARAATALAMRTVVLGCAADAVPLAATIAMSPRPGAAGPALVAVWSSDDAVGLGASSADDSAGEGIESSAAPVRRGVATRSAAQLAARLSARELRAVARGRLAWLALPPEPASATAAVRRASAVVDGPLVTALCGPRPVELDGLVAEHDLTVVAAAPDAPLARAAVAQLVTAGVTACACAPLPRGPMRTLALAGLAGPRLGVLGEVNGSR
jgi:hypothetical protein